MAASLGCATFQPSDSLNAGGVATVGLLYFGPTVQPASRAKAATKIRETGRVPREEFFRVRRLLNDGELVFSVRFIEKFSFPSSQTFLRSGHYFLLMMTPAFPPQAHTIHIKINDGSGIEREHLAENQTANDCDAQRAPKFRSGSCAERQR